MNTRTATVFLLVLGLVSAVAPVYAHHGAASYDNTKSVTIKGTITDFLFTNPHAQIYFDAKDDSGTVQHWALELGSPSWLVRKNWTRHSLKAGDEATFVAHPNKDANVRVMSLVKVTLPNGDELDNGQPQ